MKDYKTLKEWRTRHIIFTFLFMFAITIIFDITSEILYVFRGTINVYVVALVFGLGYMITTYYSLKQPKWWHTGVIPFVE